MVDLIQEISAGLRFYCFLASNLELQGGTGARKGNWSPEGELGALSGKKTDAQKKHARARPKLFFLRRERARGEVFFKQGAEGQGLLCRRRHGHRHRTTFGD